MRLFIHVWLFKPFVPLDLIVSPELAPLIKANSRRYSISFKNNMCYLTPIDAN